MFVDILFVVADTQNDVLSPKISDILDDVRSLMCADNLDDIRSPTTAKIETISDLR